MKISLNRKKQRSFTQEYWQLARTVLAITTQPILNLIALVPPKELKQRVSNIMVTKPMQVYLINLWTNVGGWYANDMFRQLGSKSRVLTTELKEQVDPEDIIENIFDRAMQRYIEARALIKAEGIVRTQVDLINQTIDLVLREGIEEGLGIDIITERLKQELTKKLRLVQDYEAERIARTEVVGASNKSSFDAANATGLNIQKGWLTSGLKGTRDSHILYESYGFVSMGNEYAPGLKYPGDPNGSADEIINCRCTIIYNTD